jgi:hypothetical protein
VCSWGIHWNMRTQCSHLSIDFYFVQRKITREDESSKSDTVCQQRRTRAKPIITIILLKEHRKIGREGERARGREGERARGREGERARGREGRRARRRERGR